MSVRQTADLQSLVLQGKEHLRSLQEILGRGEPPERAALQRLTQATRALRGSASLLGLDAYQSCLGRLFALLEDVGASEVPWSAQLEELLEEARQCARKYLEALVESEARPSTAALERLEERLASWRREAARRFEEAPGRADPQQVVSQSDVSQRWVQDVAALVRQARELHTLANAARDERLHPELKPLARELHALARAMTAPPEAVGTAPTFEAGLRNHCEGVLRSLVEAAAQEVLDEAQERGSRLAIRATGSLGEVDDELGGAILEILRNLWSDSLLLQRERAEAHIDCVLRVDEDRLVLEVRDPDAVRRGHGEDDVLANCPGLRRSRPVVESLQGLVWVQPQDTPGCRFRLALPRSTTPSACHLIRVGTHAVAVPAPALEAVHHGAASRVLQDGTGAVVQLTGARYPVLQLAFALQDQSYEERERELVLIVGSFERRAALFASGPCAAVRGVVQPGPEGPWLGTLETGRAAVPVLDVAGLLGRRRGPSAGGAG
ncbi:MAG TPA: hypothetical protein VFE28_16580 [Candidatus Krumholzibacteria bacterium]|jgi:chemotaxis protein histidine kinase CheA|nr:hypothetical protein [Candidatus Krumholzibacteria bacterium]